MSNETLASEIYREAAMADEWPATVPTTIHGYLHTPNLPIGLTPCEAAGIAGASVNGCPYTGTDICTCDE